MRRTARGSRSTSRGRLATFKKLSSGNLEITLTREGRTEARDGAEFNDLIESQIANGWEYVQPEEVGALTDATIITDDCVRDDDGNLVECGRVYSNINYYQVEDDVERLLRLKKLVWRGVA